MKATTDGSDCLESADFVWGGFGETEADIRIGAVLENRLKREGSKNVLDLGCGSGALTGVLAPRGRRVAGADCSESGLELAKAGHPSLDFRLARLEDALPSDLRGCFDAVIAVEVIEHLLLPRTQFKRVGEGLRDGGLFVVATPYHGYLEGLAIMLVDGHDKHWHPGRYYRHVKFFSFRTLTELAEEQGWTVVGKARVGMLPLFASSMMFLLRKNDVFQRGGGS